MQNWPAKIKKCIIINSRMYWTARLNLASVKLRSRAKIQCVKVIRKLLNQNNLSEFVLNSGWSTQQFNSRKVVGRGGRCHSRVPSLVGYEQSDFCGMSRLYPVQCPSTSSWINYSGDWLEHSATWDCFKNLIDFQTFQRDSWSCRV